MFGIMWIIGLLDSEKNDPGLFAV